MCVRACACVRIQKQPGTCSEMGDRRSDYISCSPPLWLPTAVWVDRTGIESLVHDRCKWLWTVASKRKAFKCLGVSVNDRNGQYWKTKASAFQLCNRLISTTETSSLSDRSLVWGAGMWSKCRKTEAVWEQQICLHFSKEIHTWEQ